MEMSIKRHKIAVKSSKAVKIRQIQCKN
jgi:hypothetical protein